MEEKKIVIVIPSYNNAQWYQKNLASVFSQQYSNFRVLYVDDCSSDGTGDLVEQYIAKNNKGELVKLTKNTERLGALCNLYNMIHSCEDDEIIVTLDGDDWLAHPKVLQRVNLAYVDGNTWLTYGQYKDSHGGMGCSRQLPQQVINNSSYRQSPWCTSHLRTWYTWLFKKIRKEDMIGKDGKFYPVSWDLTILFPLLELGGHHSKFIPDALYIYNIDTPINDYKVSRQLQIDLEFVMRAKPRYSRIEGK